MASTEQIPGPPHNLGQAIDETRHVTVAGAREPHTVWAYGQLRKLFFVTGHARSGTTWAAAVLMRHPRVFVDGEYHFHLLRTGFEAFRREPFHRASRDPVRSTAETCFRDTVRCCIGACIHQKLGAEWVGDRTPRPLEVFLPGAPHFVIIRDGRDVAVSLSILEINNRGGIFFEFRTDPRLQQARRHFDQDPDYFKKHPFELLAAEPFVRAIARRWADQALHDLNMIERIRAGEFQATTVHTVFYEQLHSNPEAEREKMYRFLGVDPAAADPLTAESGTRPGLQTDDHRSDKRKGIVGDWMNYFTDDAKRWFKEEAREALVLLGYEQNDNW